jgi:hypothetical protein
VVTTEALPVKHMPPIKKICPQFMPPISPDVAILRWTHTDDMQGVSEGKMKKAGGL